MSSLPTSGVDLFSCAFFDYTLTSEELVLQHHLIAARSFSQQILPITREFAFTNTWLLRIQE
jgi:hypothetical protein